MVEGFFIKKKLHLLNYKKFIIVRQVCIYLFRYYPNTSYWHLYNYVVTKNILCFLYNSKIIYCFTSQT